MRPFAVAGMLPYPSGALHLGHARVYTISDVRARHARAHGTEVLHPMGWDAFGLPAENAAIARGVDPAAWTRDNVAAMRSTMRAMDWSFEADEIDTSSPQYYRWTQWLFLLLHRRGLAYEADGWVNWCPSCATVLADEQVVGGCWRCGSAVARERRPQWYFRITAYAQALWDGLDRLDGWDPSAVAVQRSWIGREEGTVVDFGVLQVFTARPETVGGAVALLVPLEHPLAADAEDPTIRARAREALRRSTVERQTGVPAGFSVGMSGVHPTTGDAIPVWVAEHVVDCAICVPAHDDRDRAFAAAMGLPDGGSATPAVGTPSVRFRLRDWSVGRQRRWGCPIPMVRCPSCGPVPVPEVELPVLLDAPAERPCPSCNAPAVRDPDTLDTFVCSSWYVFRYCDPRNPTAPFSREAVDRWLPLPVYIGGISHAAQHLLYFRFVTRALHDAGWLGFDEPVEGFVANGMVLGDDGRKMSKSGTNGQSPDAVLCEHAADALRLAVLADVPVERDVPWNEERVVVAERFLARIARIFDDVPDVAAGDPRSWPDRAQLTRIAQTFDALDRDIRANSLHNAVARLHTLTTELRAVVSATDRSPAAAVALARDVLTVMSPFVPRWVTARWRPEWGEVRWPFYGITTETARWVLQVDGRTVTTVDWPVNVGDPADRAAVDPQVRRRIADRSVIRTIVVPGRLVNLVTAIEDRKR